MGRREANLVKFSYWFSLQVDLALTNEHYRGQGHTCRHFSIPCLISEMGNCFHWFLDSWINVFHIFRYVWYVCGCEFEYVTLFLLNSRMYVCVCLCVNWLLSYIYSSVRCINSQLKRPPFQSFSLVNSHSDIKWNTLKIKVSIKQ